VWVSAWVDKAIIRSEQTGAAVLLKAQLRRPADYLDQPDRSVYVFFVFPVPMRPASIDHVRVSMTSSWWALVELLVVVACVAAWAAWEMRSLRREALRREQQQKSTPDENDGVDAP
jgi:hypothetical protein